jgi:arginine utilization protein RocB
VKGILEKEVSFRMVLISNSSSIIYTLLDSDPYSNGNVSAMVSQNQANRTSVIGSANFDIGHVFGTNSGGLAALITI